MSLNSEVQVSLDNIGAEYISFDLIGFADRPEYSRVERLFLQSRIEYHTLKDLLATIESLDSVSELEDDSASFGLQLLRACAQTRNASEALRMQIGLLKKEGAYLHQSCLPHLRDEKHKWVCGVNLVCIKALIDGSAALLECAEEFLFSARKAERIAGTAVLAFLGTRK